MSHRANQPLPTSSRPRRGLAAVVAASGALLAVLACLLALPSTAAADAACDRYASPSGSDANPGTRAAPVRSIARLIAITGAGQDGCLPAGTHFDEPLGTFIVDGAGGQPGSPARIRSEDPAGPPASVKGALWVKPAVHDLVFERIRFVGSPGSDKSTMLVVHGDRITFREVEMTWRRGICFNGGHRDGYVAGNPASTVAAEGLVIERSRIHHCGNHPDIVASLRTAGQSGVHGIYLINAPGARIRDNYIHDNIARGVQLWPDVDGAVVEHNVFDGNGSNINVGSSAAYGHFSENNRIADNIVTHAVLRSVYDHPWGPGDTESIVGNFPAGTERGNVFAGNCIHQPDGRRYGGYGYSRQGDVFADPRYVDRAAGDYRLAAGSPCAGKGPRVDVPAPGEDDGGPDRGGDGAEPRPRTKPEPRTTTRPRGGSRPAVRPRLRLLGRPAVRRGRLRLRLRSSSPMRASIAVVRLSGRRGKRSTTRRVQLRRGTSQVFLKVNSRPGARCRITIAAVDTTGRRTTLRWTGALR